MSFEIVVETESLEVAASGNVVGIVYALIDGEPFPDERWWDFPCLVLGGWLDLLGKPDERTVTLRFMDGPAKIECERTAGPSARHLVLMPIIDRSPPVLFGRSEVDEALVAAALRRAALATIRACRERELPDQGLPQALRGAAR